jgi:hypothetical protein
MTISRVLAGKSWNGTSSRPSRSRLASSPTSPFPSYVTRAARTARSAAVLSTYRQASSTGRYVCRCAACTGETSTSNTYSITSYLMPSSIRVPAGTTLAGSTISAKVCGGRANGGGRKPVRSGSQRRWDVRGVPSFESIQLRRLLSGVRLVGRLRDPASDTRSGRRSMRCSSATFVSPCCGLASVSGRPDSAFGACTARCSSKACRRSASFEAAFGTAAGIRKRSRIFRHRIGGVAVRAPL